MITGLEAAKFFLDLGKAIKEWASGRRDLQSKDREEAAEILKATGDTLFEVGNALSEEPVSQRAESQRYYLESNLSNLAWTLRDRVDNQLLDRALDHLRNIKVHDGVLVPEVSAIITDAEQMSPIQKREIVAQIYRAAGEFRSIADLVRAGYKSE